jgi:hypothetical protein
MRIVDCGACGRPNNICVLIDDKPTHPHVCWGCGDDLDAQRLVSLASHGSPIEKIDQNQNERDHENEVD